MANQRSWNQKIEAKNKLKQRLFNKSRLSVKSCITNIDLTRQEQQIAYPQIKNGRCLLTEIGKINWLQLFDGWAELGLLHQCTPWSRHNSLWDKNRKSSPRQSCCSRGKLDAIQNMWAAQCLLGCKARSRSVSGRSKANTTGLIHSIRQFFAEPISVIRRSQSKDQGFAEAN